jgi:hypothetical protein
MSKQLIAVLAGVGAGIFVIGIFVGVLATACMRKSKKASALGEPFALEMASDNPGAV